MSERPADSVERMNMALEHAGECIERAMREARFRNIWGQSFDAPVMRELYARKRHHEYRLSGAESISVGEGELDDLVRYAACRCLRGTSGALSASRVASMMPVKHSSFGRRTGFLQR